MADIPKKESLQQEISRLRATLKQVEKKNYELEKKLRQYEFAATASSEGLWDFDLVSNEIFTSQSLKNILGYSDAEIVHNLNTWQRLVHPEDRERVSRLFTRYIEKKSHYDLAFRMQRKDGVYRWIGTSGRVVRNKEGKAIRISGSFTDITEKKRAEVALTNSERKFRNLFENSMVGMVRSNDKGVVLDANRTALKIFRVNSLEEIHAADFYRYPLDRLRLLKDLETEGWVENREINFKRKDGTFFWGSISAVLYPDDGFMEVVIVDVTSMKENLLELKKVNLELDNFVYHASHDLRSPLRSILGLVNILRMGKMSKEQNNCVDLIEGSIQRMDKLVTDLLSISRNSRINDPNVPLNFLIEINNSIASFYHDSKNKNLVINAWVYQPVDFISDLTRIRIILNNVISNAIKYRSFQRDLSYINIEVHVDQKKAHITIEDNGEGIPASKLPTIFNMFVRASETGEGSGLGLYIVKDVLQKLKGKIEVTSELNVGTKIEIEIPNGVPPENV